MAQATQKERVQQAVEAATEAIREDGKRVQHVAAADAIEYVDGYEPSGNELKAFRKAWNDRQLEVDDDVDDEADEVEAVASGEEPQGEVEPIDPFAGDDDDVPATLKMDDRRKIAVERAVELLGEDAETAAAEEAILALRHDGHEFYGVMKGSASQASKFMADFRKTQPGNENGKKKRLSEAYKTELQKMRANLSSVRKSTEKGEVVKMLEEVKELADVAMSKIDASENDES